MVLKKGDWVVYEDITRKNKPRKIGRVWMAGDEAALVCYHKGCNATMTPLHKLRLYDETKDTDLIKDPGIGHRRFVGFCPDFDPMCPRNHEHKD